MKTCPNCSSPVVNHPANGCALAVLISVVKDRGNKGVAELHALHEGCDVDALWEALGPIVDMLEDGEFAGEKTS